MIRLPKEQFDRAANAFAAGFYNDPVYSRLLPDTFARSQYLYDFFRGTLLGSKGYKLYTTSERQEGFLCFYRSHEFSDGFDGVWHSELDGLEDHLILENYYTENYAVLDLMTVTDPYRGQGLAKEMVRFFLEDCRNSGRLPLVEIFGDRHLPFYKSLGFVVTHQKTIHEITTYVLEYTL